ncbi:hypothetical protein AAHB34_06265 [Paenarthrobacter ureafaciens]
MTWTLDSGLSLSDELILSAAPAADSPSTAELALRAAAAVKEPGNVPEAKLLRARALIAEGQLQAATPELRALATADRQPGVRSAAANRLAALSLMGAAPVPAAADVSEPATTILDAVREAGQLLTAGNAPEALGEVDGGRPGHRCRPGCGNLPAGCPAPSRHVPAPQPRVGALGNGAAHTGQLCYARPSGRLP